MGKINDGIKYPIDTKVSANDRLIGSDAEKGGQTKNFKVEDIANFIKDFIGSESVGASWVYSCDGDEHEYGNFYTPGVCYTGNDDPGFQDITEIIISNKDLNNVDALRYLELANNGGVMMLLMNKNDINNYLLISDLTVNSSSVPGYSTLIFSNTVTSKSFKQGDEYSFNILGSSPTFLRLVKEKKTVLANTTAPTEDNTVHIGQGDGVKITPNGFYLNMPVIMFTNELFTNLESPDRPSDPNTIKTFRMLCINDGGRVYPLEYGDVQPDWLDEGTNSRYHIKNRYPQKEINSSSYMLTASDNGHTIFINNGSGNCQIYVNHELEGMNNFRFCKFIQMGTGSVTINGYQSGMSITNVLIPSGTQNKIIGQNHQVTLTRQVIQEDDVMVYGDFYLGGSLVGSVGWSLETV